MSSEKLFKDFKAISKAEWKQKTIQDLKGADFEENLHSELEKGLKIASFYAKQDLASLSYLQNYHQQNLTNDVNKQGARHWYNQPLITVFDAKIANKQALEALANGADALLFDIKNEFEYKDLLKDILVEHCLISFRIKGNALEFLSYYFEYVQDSGAKLSKVKGNLFAPLNDLGELKNRIEMCRLLPDFYPIVLSENQNLETNTEKIADILTQSVQIIRALVKNELLAVEVINNIQFSIAVDNHYFLSIAKIKSLKMLFSEVSEAFLGSQTSNSDAPIHVFTTIEEGKNHKNMISNSTQAMSAILGGCQSLSILSHDLNQNAKNESFSLRIARNVSTILREESYFDKITDPVAGSYYIENLIDSFAEKTWQIFQAKV